MRLCRDSQDGSVTTTEAKKTLPSMRCDNVTDVTDEQYKLKGRREDRWLLPALAAPLPGDLALNFGQVTFVTLSQPFIDKDFSK